MCTFCIYKMLIIIYYFTWAIVIRFLNMAYTRRDICFIDLWNLCQSLCNWCTCIAYICLWIYDLVRALDKHPFISRFVSSLFLTVKCTQTLERMYQGKHTKSEMRCKQMSIKSNTKMYNICSSYSIFQTLIRL